MPRAAAVAALPKKEQRIAPAAAWLVTPRTFAAIEEPSDRYSPPSAQVAAIAGAAARNVARTSPGTDIDGASVVARCRRESNPCRGEVSGRNATATSMSASAIPTTM